MEKPDITGGLKSAVQRGYSLEQAKASFINAGYNPGDVEDSARVLSGVLSIMPEQPASLPSFSAINKLPATQPAQFPSQKQIIQPSQLSIQQPKPRKSAASLIIILLLTIILLILLGFLISSIFFKQEIIEFAEKNFNIAL